MARTRSVSLKTKAAAKASAKVSGKVSAKPGVKGRARISAAEWETRVDLAAAFRIAYHLGWNDKITNHITARVPDRPDHFRSEEHTSELQSH